MSTPHPETGQPVGRLVENWSVPPRPSRRMIGGKFCRLEPLDAELHAADLFHAYALDTENKTWTYLYYGPFAALGDYTDWVRAQMGTDDPLLFAIVDTATGKATGVAGYMRIAPEAGSIEVGHVVYSPLLQRTRAATEAMYLMMRHAFHLGYRRYEWKCDALNQPSRDAALRLGFTFEGIFRQACVIKGRNRDTAWFSVIDSEWPSLEFAFERWLRDDNSDVSGRQKRTLAELRSFS